MPVNTLGYLPARRARCLPRESGVKGAGVGGRVGGRAQRVVTQVVEKNERENKPRPNVDVSNSRKDHGVVGGRKDLEPETARAPLLTPAP